MNNLLVFEDNFFIYPLMVWGVVFHLLFEREKKEAVLIDTGLVGGFGSLGKLLGHLGLVSSDIKAILLTHGHLDHTGSLAAIAESSGAPVFAHAADQTHIDGTFPYGKASRICGALEATGRVLFRFRRKSIDRYLVDGMDLPFWGGLKVIHLPGHTDGHCGFYSRRFDLLFSGDIFASYPWSAHTPPPFLNTRPEMIPKSLERVNQLNPRLILPNHYTVVDPKSHRANFAKLLNSLAPAGSSTS